MAPDEPTQATGIVDAQNRKPLRRVGWPLARYLVSLPMAGLSAGCFAFGATVFLGQLGREPDQQDVNLADDVVQALHGASIARASWDGVVVAIIAAAIAIGVSIALTVALLVVRRVRGTLQALWLVELTWGALAGSTAILLSTALSAVTNDALDSLPPWTFTLPGVALLAGALLLRKGFLSTVWEILHPPLEPGTPGP